MGIRNAYFSPARSDRTNHPMNIDVLLLALYVAVALIFSFACSVAEAVLLSITPSYIEGLKEKHPGRAKLLARLRLENVDQSLAAILTLNTIAHTVGAIGAGAQATVVFGSTWMGVFSAVMTLMILFLSEIVPKTLGAVYWTQLAGTTAQFIRGLILGLYPLVWVSEKITRLIAREKQVHLFNRKEFLAMARIGEQMGHIDDREFRILRNLLRLGSLNITDVMTPRTVITAIPKDQTIGEALDQATRVPFSRLPLYGEDIDDIAGVVLKDDILLANARDGGHEPLESLKRDVLFVPPSMTLPVLMERLLDSRQHIALVVDEYGATIGLVTLEDIVETLLGMEIMDEVDDVADLQALAREQWERRAKALGIARPDSAGAE